jgi:hypothetical protein
MAWRIEKNVVRGELDNGTPGRVDGTIWLADRTEPLVLHLIGNCHNDLAGCRLTFSNPAPKPDPGMNLVTDQSGVVGDITAARKARVIENFDYLAIKAGKKLPEHLANCFLPGMVQRGQWASRRKVEDRQDKDVEEMLAGYMAVGPKVAGALGSVSRGIEEEDSLKGLVVAKLKRALGELSRELNAAERLKERKLDLPFQLEDWIPEMFEIREELLSLMNQFRGVR